MIGYDRGTGWSHLTPTKWRRYHRPLPAEPDDVGERCREQKLPFYFDHAGGLHARCGEGALWTLLSGEPADWDSEPPAPGTERPEYLTVTDVGVNLTPRQSATQTNQALARAGLQARENGAWVATAAGLLLSFEVVSESGHCGGKNYLKWSFEVIRLLQR